MPRWWTTRSYCIGCRSRNCTRLPGVVAGDRATRRWFAFWKVSETVRGRRPNVMATLLRQARIRGWVANYPTAGYYVDVAFPEKMLAVEIDGFASHGGARAFQRDRTRRNALTTAGWTVINFTWADLTDRPEYVTDCIRQAPNCLTADSATCRAIRHKSRSLRLAGRRPVTLVRWWWDGAGSVMR